MGSLSFDNIFPAEPEDRLENAAWQPKRLPAKWSNSLPDVLTEVQTLDEASPWATSALRRFLDLGIAGLALVAFSPLMLMAAALVWLDSSGPVFFRQRRMGRNGREFTLYKFRSMRHEGGGNACITVSGDCRITAVGSLLRRYKLDELPQFWNVLRGEMGLVGPRPKLPHHEALHLTCRPGITGAATLAFRNEEEFLSEIPRDELEVFYENFVKPAKAHLDMEYMRTATLVGDLRILWRTATACLLSPEESLPDAAGTIARMVSGRIGPARADHPGKSAAAKENAYVASFNAEM